MKAGVTRIVVDVGSLGECVVDLNRETTASDSLKTSLHVFKVVEVRHDSPQPYFHNDIAPISPVIAAAGDVADASSLSLHSVRPLAPVHLLLSQLPSFLSFLILVLHIPSLPGSPCVVATIPISPLSPQSHIRADTCTMSVHCRGQTEAHVIPPPLVSYNWGDDFPSLPDPRRRRPM